jgi:hypothetical protein
MKTKKGNVKRVRYIYKNRVPRLGLIIVILMLILASNGMTGMATLYNPESTLPVKIPGDITLVRPRPLNYPPVANDDYVTVYMDSVDNIIDVLADDIDPEGDSLTIINITAPSNGTVTLNGSMVLYTPTSAFVGADQFTYTISDGNGGTDTADVFVTVEDLQMVLMIGLINNVSYNYNFTSFKARFMLLISFNPFTFAVYSSDEEFVVSNLYFGSLRQRIIFGLFLILPSPVTT